VSKQTENFYNNFSFFYPLIDIFLRRQKRTLFQEVNNVPSGHLLEIGVGNGAHLQLYKTHTIVAIDTSSNMLAVARKQNSNVELLQMNGEALSFQDQTFDYVVLSHVIAVVDNPEKLLNEAYRVLRPNGRMFILNHFTPKNWLRHIDKSFQLLSKMFHFKSVFCINRLTALKKFVLLKEISFGRLSYFKLLIYNKA
jgi:phosphatidylethanolamine/phosphatidyl-N-methylethanolamine N-methyltransferase